MVAADHPAWNTQLPHDTGTDAHRSLGCLAAHIAEPPRFGEPDAPINTAWVTEYGTEAFIRASNAFFICVTNPDHVADVMLKNPMPFGTREAAIAFTESFDRYDENDILRFSDFDMALATVYRGKFLEGDEEHSSEGNESAVETTSTA